MSKRRAILLDRDGTLVHPYHYPSRPEHLQLYDNIGLELRALQEHGFLLIVITNQSGLARGYFTMDDLQCMHAHLQQELSVWQVRIDGIYYCPHHIDGVIPELAVTCACRKPQPGMLLEAARDFTLDLSSSWFVGDFLDDVEAGNRAGCRTILVDYGKKAREEATIRVPDFVAASTQHALSIIREVEYV